MTGPVTSRPTSGPRRLLPRDRRFLRWAVPTLVVAVLFTVTVVTWALNHVTPADRDFLEPGSAAGIGSRTLARRLERHGTAVHRYTGTPAAVAAARAGHRTVLVTAPDYVQPGYLADLLRLPATDRLVLVAPSATLLVDAGLPARRTGSRWTTGVTDAACPAPAAGPAAVLGTRYRPEPATAGRVCYHGGLVVLRPGGDTGPRLILVGAADVFRNDRIDEHRNAALADMVLGDTSAVVWLSLHRPETVAPPPSASPGPPAGENPAPTGPTPTGSEPADRRSAPPEGDAGTGSSGDTGSPGDDRGSGSAPNPLWSTFPSWLWAIIAQVLIAAVLYALWRARRLGAPVPEPLPVVVHATETVTGRGRLYHRARDRGATLATLRDGALRRLAPLLDVEQYPDTVPGGKFPSDRDDAHAARRVLVDTLAARSGWSPERVESVLYGAAPDDDAGLAAAVGELDDLVRRVRETREGTAGAGTV